MRTKIAVILFALVANVSAPTGVLAGQAGPARGRPNESDFVRDYRVSHYLGLAVALQALVPDERAARLRAIARDSARSYEIFPLCRMLFEAKDGGAFRRPMIGAPVFVAGTSQDWPLEPITLSDGFPFLIVRGYTLAGKAESALQYVAYCLANCQWSQRKYTGATKAQVEQILERLMTSNPALRVHADWLRLQTG